MDGWMDVEDTGVGAHIVTAIDADYSVSLSAIWRVLLFLRTNALPSIDPSTALRARGSKCCPRCGTPPTLSGTAFAVEPSVRPRRRVLGTRPTAWAAPPRPRPKCSVRRVPSMPAYGRVLSWLLRGHALAVTVERQ